MGERFARGGGRFPLECAHAYGSQLWPDFGVPDAFAAKTPGRSDPRALPAMLELIDRLGRAVLVTHSQGGDLGWKTALARPDKVAAIVAIEPAQTCPGLDDPAFPDIPVLIVWGDNLPAGGVTLSMQDVILARAIAARRPHLSVDWLPEQGIKGNGHMMMMEDNNEALARRVQDWLLRSVPHQVDEVREQG
jgi:pimeloyl-ACP methyl ester carboxylesterase